MAQISQIGKPVVICNGIPHEDASRPVRGEELGFFTFWGQHDPQKVKKPHDLWQRQARSAEALPCSR
jgi:hypothetical protein